MGGTLEKITAWVVEQKSNSGKGSDRGHDQGGGTEIREQNIGEKSG